jgi:hypothetical protein
LQQVDADKLFNLFSNYGNIVRIKFLHNKPDHALIQMGDGLQAELAVSYLKVCVPAQYNTFFFIYYVSVNEGSPCGLTFFLKACC